MAINQELNKVKAIKIKQPTGLYSNEIPLGVDGRNVDMLNGKTLEELIGEMEVDEQGDIVNGSLSGSIKDQILHLNDEKAGNESLAALEQELAAAKDSITVLSRKLIGVDDKEVTNFKDLQKFIDAGTAHEMFNIGDEFITTWTDVTDGVQYKMPLVLANVDTRSVRAQLNADGTMKLNRELAVGEEAVPADVLTEEVDKSLVLQLKYCLPFGIQFSNYQAFYVAETQPLAAGTYYVTMNFTEGNQGNVATGKMYKFTLTKELPIGGQLSGFEQSWGQAVSNWRVKSWADNTATTPLETVTVSEMTEVDTSAISLGTFTKAGSATLNSLHNVSYGNNIYYQSAYRQWLNSDKPKDEWWKPMNKWDRCPKELASKAGFLTGLTDDLKAILRPYKVITEMNDVTSVNTNGVPTYAFDKVFLPSLEEMAANPQIGTEHNDGDILAADEKHWFEYWKEALGGKKSEGGKAPVAQWSTNPELIHFQMVRSDNSAEHGGAQYVRLRSADRSYGCVTWFVYSSGHVHYGPAIYSVASAPAFRLGKN